MRTINKDVNLPDELRIDSTSKPITYIKEEIDNIPKPIFSSKEGTGHRLFFRADRTDLANKPNRPTHIKRPIPTLASQTPSGLDIVLSAQRVKPENPAPTAAVRHTPAPTPRVSTHTPRVQQHQMQSGKSRNSH